MTRISELRRRRWADDESAVPELTEALRAPGGEQTLKQIQACTIRETVQVGGACAWIRVGGGKTLTSGLLATIYEDIRPLIVVPGGHGAKTELEFAAYRKHWNLSHKLQVVTYNDIARDADERLLRAYHPGILICDEVDKLRRVARGGSGTAARFADWMAAYPKTQFVGMSGTMFKEGLTDFAHILNWALKDSAPIPRLPADILTWHKGLKGASVFHPAMRGHLGVPEGADVRSAFRERLWSAPGLLISLDCFTGVPLTIETCAFDSGTQDELRRLYETGETPDGMVALDSGEAEADTGVWAQQRRLALGFYHKPDPRPPAPWAKARRRYASWVRAEIMEGNFRTELQARRWAIKHSVEAWLEWEKIQPTFQPNFVPVWMNDTAIRYCKDWGRGGGIIWTDHRAFAERLSLETGWRRFAEGGLDSTGQMIETCTDRVIIASRFACGTGRNLQRWCRGLVTACPGNGRDAEQLFGRQHREGQTRPVELFILLGCMAHANDLRKVVDLSDEESEEMGRRNKVLTATWR